MPLPSIQATASLLSAILSEKLADKPYRFEGDSVSILEAHVQAYKDEAERLELLDMLQANDRNGSYTDANCLAEGMDPLTMEEARLYAWHMGQDISYGEARDAAEYQIRAAMFYVDAGMTSAAYNYAGARLTMGLVPKDYDYA